MHETAQGTVREGEEFRVDGRRARRLLSGAELEPFTRLDDLRSVLAPLATFGLIALLVAAGLAAWGHWWVVALVVLAIAAQQHALFVLAHEAAHYRMFSSRPLNDLVGRIAGTLGGISMCTYRVTHRLHHNHLYGRQDPDIALNGGYPRGAGYLAKKLLIDLSGWTAPKTYAYFFGAPAINSATNEALRPLDDTSPSLRDAARRDRWWVAGFHLAMPCVVLALGGVDGLLKYLVLWVLPLATVLQAILRLRAVAEHGAPAGYDSPLTAARTNLPGTGPLGWLVRFAFFPHHVNYHIEHHLYPAVPHYRLRALHARLREEGALEDAEVREFASTMRRVFAPRAVAAQSR
jgi:fatty acid desaturase